MSNPKNQFTRIVPEIFLAIFFLVTFNKMSFAQTKSSKKDQPAFQPKARGNSNSAIRQKIPTHASETERNPYKYSTLNNFEGTAITNTTNTDQCGFKPIAKFGCEIGECINGVWKQNCSSPELECGFKPIPEVGCVVGKCINGTWEQVCKHRSKPQCGFKPMPKDGCEVGACVNGQWEIKCKGSPERLECGFKPYPNDGCTIGKCVNGSWEQKCK